MTLIGAFSYGNNKTVFVSDFRTKSPLSHADNAFKIQPIGNNGGILLAGNVNGWINILEREMARLKEIPAENFLEEFRDVLLNYALTPSDILTPGRRLSALGFIINKSNNTNISFYVDYIQGEGVSSGILEENKLYLFGSGADITGLKQYLNNMMFNYISDQTRPLHQKEPYLVANVLEQAVVTYLENLNDPTIYRQKGISNVFWRGYLEAGFFIIESYDDKKYEKNNPIVKEMSLKKDQNGDMVLIDVTNHKSSKLNFLSEVDVENPITIDPFDREAEEES